MRYLWDILIEINATLRPARAVQDENVRAKYAYELSKHVLCVCVAAGRTFPFVSLILVLHYY